MRKAKRYDRNTHDPTAGLCYPWIFLLALTHLTLSSLPTRLFPVPLSSFTERALRGEWSGKRVI